MGLGPTAAAGAADCRAMKERKWSEVDQRDFFVGAAAAAAASAVQVCITCFIFSFLGGKERRRKVFSVNWAEFALWTNLMARRANKQFVSFRGRRASRPPLDRCVHFSNDGRDVTAAAADEVLCRLPILSAAGQTCYDPLDDDDGNEGRTKKGKKRSISSL